MINSHIYALTGLALSVCTMQASAQWIDDSTIHQVVADGPGEQVQPKVVPTSQGGCYISWFSSMDGYDVWVQQLDKYGSPQWGLDGLLIADRDFSSTQDYDIVVDENDIVTLVFRENRDGQTKIVAHRRRSNGVAVWGPDGIELSNGTDFVASPDIALSNDGSVVVGWINNSDTNLAKIAFDGTIEWETTISDPNGQGVNLASMHASDNGSVILSWVQFAQFFDPKHLYAQKIDTSGNEVWNSRVPVFDGGSLQFGDFPEFTPDGLGGAVFSWYDTGNSLNVYAQHLNADGTERYIHNGVAGSTAPRERVNPSAIYDPHTDSVVMSWLELANNQGDRGVYSQRINAMGQRMWTDSGVEISPIDGNDSSSITVQMIDEESMTLWIENTGGFGQDQVHAHALDSDGLSVWESGVVVLASDLADRSRLATTSTGEGVIACWQRGPFGEADVESHIIVHDGSLSTPVCLPDLTGDGDLNFFDLSLFIDLFVDEDPRVDFNGDDEYNFFDVSFFINAFQTGCP